MEYTVVKVLSTKDNHERYSKYVRGLTKEMTLVVKDLGKFFKETGRDEVDWSVFSGWFKLVAHPSMDKETHDLYQHIFDTLERTSYKAEDTLPILHAFMDRAYAEELSLVAQKIADGGEGVGVKDLKDLLSKRDRDVGDTSSHVVKATWGGTIASASGWLRWRMKELNDSLGPAGHDLIVIGSRPDGGKTTFLASEVTHMAAQLTDKVVKWYINEEALNKVQWRIVQAALGWTMEEVEEDWVATWAAYKSALGGIDKIDLVDCSGWTVAQIESDIAASPTGLVVVDQLRKVRGYDNKEHGEVMRQELLFNWARDVAKRTGPVLVVHQAGGDADGERYIGMASLHGSKTGIQGEADAIVTIGQDPDLPDSRFLYVPKNKMRGEDPLLRNGKFEVSLDKFRARFT